jgi:hypothetical protein
VKALTDGPDVCGRTRVGVDPHLLRDLRSELFPELPFLLERHAAAQAATGTATHEQRRNKKR